MQLLKFGALTPKLITGLASGQTDDAAAPTNQPPSPVRYLWVTAYHKMLKTAAQRTAPNVSYSYSYLTARGFEYEYQ